MRPARALAALPLLLAASGCIMPDQLAQFQQDVADVRRSLETISKEQSDMAKRIDTLESVTGGQDIVKRSEIADIEARQDTMVRQTTAMSERIDQVGARVDRLSLDVQAARDAARRSAPLTYPPPEGQTNPDADAGAGAVPTVPGGPAPSPNALYTSAYADFSRGNYALAIQGFEEYAQRFPETELADNAMYWIGECKFSDGSYNAAIDAFDAMLEKYPSSDKAPAANLKKALAYVQLNQLGQAIEQLRYVTSKYPGTDEARIASDRLSALGKP